MTAPFSSPTRLIRPRSLLCGLLLAVPLCAMGFERGALAPKDEPLMPTIIHYHNDETDSATTSAPDPSPTATPPSESPAIAPEPTTSNNGPTIHYEQPLSPDVAPPPPIAAAPAPTPAPVVITPPAKVEAVNTASTHAILRGVLKTLLWMFVLAAIAAVVWWIQRPYVPPSIRREAEDEKRARKAHRIVDERTDNDNDLDYRP